VSDIAIRADGLSKRYRIGELRRYKALRDTMTNALYSPFRAAAFLFNRQASKDGGKTSNGFFWALKDISFEIKHGEVVGIIGRNGAGKSTLLKILSRITEPTSGYADIHGRVGSLIEVGTGFHPELTGRENIYLNGAIMGMKKAEIDRKFDEIIAFAELEQFLDTPVKLYSSGMYMRLAFSVAAHLEPEILLVDEVLAVGDAAFQKKCLGKMGDIAKEGRTVLFVSHNMPAILRLCSRAVMLETGRICCEGSSDVVVARSVETVGNLVSMPISQRTDRAGNQRIKFMALHVLGKNGEPLQQGISGEDLIIKLEYQTNDGKPLKQVFVSIGILGKYEEPLFHLSTRVSGGNFDVVPPRGMFSCCINRLPLQPGAYGVDIYCRVGGEVADYVQGAYTLNVEGGDYFLTGKLPPIKQGPILVSHAWDVSS